MIRKSGNRFSLSNKGEKRVCAEIMFKQKSRKLEGAARVRSSGPRQSMSSRVANSVRRDAQAVIAAIISACTASTR